jgi:GNAT superfamily N-acetyltransferase
MMIQVKPLCVLDIYVDDAVQRRGVGARLLSLACKVGR